MAASFLALLATTLVHVEVLTLLHPSAALVWQGGAPVELRADGDQVVSGTARAALLRCTPARVELAALGRRDYAGSLSVTARAGELRFVNEVPLEEYVAAVVGSELANAPPAAQAALAVVARTYALHAGAGTLCDTTQCQLYLGAQAASKAARAAARATRGEVLLGASGLAPVLHSADCGGRTALASDLWPRAGADDLEASVPVADPVCAGSAWQTTLSPADLRLLHPAEAPSLRVTETGPGGLARRVQLSGSPLTGEELSRRLSRLRKGLRPSARFTVRELSAGAVLVRGTGHGHGVGLCQCGAALLATRGASWHQILAHYYPSLRVSRLPN